MAFKKKKYTSSDIPAVTQLFTPEWIVKYLVQNSLGRYWIDVLKSKNTRLNEKEVAEKFGWKYYMPAASENRIDCNNDLADIAVQDITFMDPAMGSGHILVYAFEVFMQIYKSEGYTEREAADLILQNNLFGTDIDTRAFQLTYFALVMQGRKKDRRFFSRNIVLNIVDIPQPSDDIELLLSNVQDKKVSVASLRNMINKFANGNSLGSLIKTDSINLDDLKQLLLKTNNTKQLTLEDSELENGKNELKEIIKSVDLLSKKYTISVSNPPYMGSGKMDNDLKKYVQKNYPDSKSDLFAVFMERLTELTQKNGYIAMITQHSWMFLSSFEKLRQKIQSKTIINLAHLGPRAFEEIGGEVVQSVAFVLQNKRIADYIGTYERLTDFNTAADKEKKYLKAVNESNLGYVFRSNQTKFANIPGSPIAYWASNNLIHDFIIGNKMENLVEARQGLATAKNDLFLRQWFEVNLNTISFNSKSIPESIQSNKKWFPYNKGGSYRKWYGNYDYVVNWENDGYEIRNFKDSQGKLRSRPQNTNYYFREAITWSDVNSGNFSLRYRTVGSIHDVKGMSAFGTKSNLIVVLSIMNTKIGNYVFKMLNPTISLQVGNFKDFPILNTKKIEVCTNLVEENIELCKKDWDSFGNSWNFKKHFFLSHIAEHKQNWTIEAAYTQWEKESLDRFNQLKANEEELNKIFIDLYGLQDELTPEEDDKDVSVRKADKERDVKSFLSYFIGCVFGRYSLDTEGLAFAGGEWDSSEYHSFVPNEDNVIVLTDEDYFGDQRDIINRLKEFLTVTFGQKNLYQNLDFIASVLDQKKLDKGIESQQIIRDYFLNDFFKKDHLKIYQKRPIYWELNSGKAKGFKALIYQHRYSANTMAMIRSEYLHELQDAYENSLKFKERQRDNETDKKMIKIFEKEITNLNKKITELVKFDQELQHVASQQIEIDLDDGVVVNHKKVQADTKILTPIK